MTKQDLIEEIYNLYDDEIYAPPYECTVKAAVRTVGQLKETDKLPESYVWDKQIGLKWETAKYKLDILFRTSDTATVKSSGFTNNVNELRMYYYMTIPENVYSLIEEINILDLKISDIIK